MRLSHREVGREHHGGHVVLAPCTSQRNISAAMVVAKQGLGDTNTLVMVVVVSLMEFAVLFPLALLLKRRGRRHEEPEILGLALELLVVPAPT